MKRAQSDVFEDAIREYNSLGGQAKKAKVEAKKVETAKKAKEEAKKAETGGGCAALHADVKKLEAKKANAEAKRSARGAGDHRVAATAALDDKIAAFQKDVAKLPKNKVDVSLMRKHFAAGEMSALWKRMKAERGKDLSVRDAWTELKTMKIGQDKIKLESLFMMVGYPNSPDVWKQRLVATTDEISKTCKKASKREELSWGELCMRVGEDQALADYKKGKYEEIEDEWNDKMYVKVSKSSVLQQSRKQSIAASRHV